MLTLLKVFLQFQKLKNLSLKYFVRYFLIYSTINVKLFFHFLTLCMTYSVFYTLSPYSISVASKPMNPCVPSPCGPYSACRAVNGHAVCSCQQDYIGSPPSCRPECMVSADCPQDRACIKQKCADPCPGTCGVNARCQVVNHNPICSCAAGFTGDPFVRCLKERKLISSVPCLVLLPIVCISHLLAL